MREFDQYEFPVSDENRDLPPTLAQVAEVIGRDKALRIAGLYGGKSLAVPLNPGPKYRLSEIIGVESAQLLSREFGGIVLKIPKCCYLERRHRDASIIRLFLQGVSKTDLADMFLVNVRTIQLVTSPYNTEINKTILQAFGIEQLSLFDDPTDKL